MRETGIPIIGAVPWGTHFCQFYDTKQDLFDILVPYFKAGLENNEFCHWVTSNFISKEEAEEVMRESVPNFAQYLERGQINIVPHTEWYLKDGAFNLRKILNAWIDELNQALTKGYDGIRVSGDTAWLEKGDWRNFTEYEAELESVIGKNRMLAICTYALGKCGASEIIDVMRNHQFALIRQQGDWVLLKPEEVRKTTLPTTLEERLSPLQEWFIKSGFGGLNDLEIIELLLSLCLPLPKCKRLAKECMERFKSLRKFLAASPQELQQIGVPRSCLFCIKLLYELPAEVLKQKIIGQPVYTSPKEIFDYLYYSMRDLKKETFKVIYLNNQSQIIDTTDLFEGTVDNIFIHPREVVESAIKCNATALIFAHNHPSADPGPSRSDKQLTRDLVFAGSIFQIKVLDHIIIGGNRYFSFADEGLIRKYEDDFFNMRIKGRP